MTFQSTPSAIVKSNAILQILSLIKRFQKIPQPIYPGFNLFLFLSVLLLQGCGKPSEAPVAAAIPPAPAVKIAQPLNQETTEWHEYTGRIEAVNAVDVRARVGGYLEKVNFIAGTKVSKGQLLFLIDPKPYQAQVNFAEAELNRAKSKHELAKDDLSRAQNLFRAKAISTEEFDARNKGLREATGAVDSAKANVETAKLNLSYTEIRSPISGRISREMLTAGNLVNGGDSTILATIVSIDPVYAYMDADEQSVLQFRRQMHSSGHTLNTIPVELALADEQDFPHKGRLDYIATREDPATGTISIRGLFANPDELLSPGFFARLRIRSGAPYQALMLPDRAIATDQAQRFVWVITPDKQVNYRQVVLGARIGALRVITQGLQADDWVVIEGLQKLKPGATVNPQPIKLNEQQGAV